MIFVLGVWTFLRAILGSSAVVTLENVALRHQLAVLHRSLRRPRLRRRDRIFWVWLSRLWPGWRSSLLQHRPSPSGLEQHQPSSPERPAADAGAHRGDPAGRWPASPLSARRLIASASPVACDVGQKDAGSTALILAIGRSSCSSPRPKLPRQGGSVRPLAPVWSGNSFGRPIRFLTGTTGRMSSTCGGAEPSTSTRS